ncbi:MAG: 1-deoxy-D-xylulose-5-phosphate reductoisomerase [Erysipelotrichaceae bacterium]|nr:1-deoxy-D-xylulose-5-phosphate reductoisomerase [Erysipelotrichaceae bacterium]
MSKSIVLLGASGSIGYQTLDIVKKNPQDFNLFGISIGHKTRKINGILSHFPSIKAVCIQDKNKVNYYQKHYPSVKFFSGDEGLINLIDYCKAEMVVNALVGFVGLYPSIYSLTNNYKLALANKESLVVGGDIINDLLAKGHGELFPIDSEHSALWKCLKVKDTDVDKLVITASGGAFRKLNRDQLVDVKASDALKHPTWKMGPKITIDCASMVNKSFEVIEAYYLFGYDYEHISILLHDESMIHSLVKYKDGTYRAEVSYPDMRNPIRFALYEGNIPFDTEVSDDYHKFGPYHFHDFDINRYPVVNHARTVMEKGGTYGAVFNASNEVAVHAYLKDEIPFLAIESLINRCMNEHHNEKAKDYETLLRVDQKTRKYVRELIEKGEY